MGEREGKDLPVRVVTATKTVREHVLMPSGYGLSGVEIATEVLGDALISIRQGMYDV